MEDIVKTVCIVQARMGSSRLPGKVMKVINDIPMIELLLERLKYSKEIDEIVVAIPSGKQDKELCVFLESKDYLCEMGSEEDVLDRYSKVSKKYEADIVVRITGDCPLVDPDLVDKIIRLYKTNKVDYCSNICPPSFPDGFDVEVFSSSVLYEVNQEAKHASDREHVTSFIRNSTSFNKLNYENIEDLSDLRLTVDELDDFILIDNIYSHFYPRINFSWEEVIGFYVEEPEIFKINNHIKRNTGELMGKGQKLWKRAKTLIPGGNMLLSKRPEMFLPDFWPSYYSKSKGCRVWDLDHNEYIDMSVMGIGTNILGYSNDEVDSAVKGIVSKGNMSTLNCPEEVFLAEKLIEINPWAQMVRFARTGGEANAIAVRIARAASGKDNIAICGYHGWHDWYLATNLGSDDALDEHLLSGLSPEGVPKNLKNTVFPFQYNNFNQLKEIVKENDIGVIKMEVTRNEGPLDNFLQNVRDLATKNGIVLIFDECTSGFRENYGGIHANFDVQPDLAIYGKAMGNGYAITAVVGKEEIMEAAQSTFISSTFWTERIGPTAALKTLELMEKLKSWELITQKGKRIKDEWKRIAKKNDLDIDITGISPLPVFNFKSNNKLAYKTFITQEMLKKGYLAANSVYVCIWHDDQIIDEYINELDLIFRRIKECEEGKDILEMLDGPICHDGFSRLN
tara:strand:+ start:1734 stop:3773 length:2040 start_codon:yes stop_codon:yes gene_type:complete